MLRLSCPLNVSIEQVYMRVVGGSAIPLMGDNPLTSLANKIEFAKGYSLVKIEDDGFFTYGIYSFEVVKGFNYVKCSVSMEDKVSLNNISILKDQIVSKFGDCICGEFYIKHVED